MQTVKNSALSVEQKKLQGIIAMTAKCSKSGFVGLLDKRYGKIKNNTKMSQNKMPPVSNGNGRIDENK